MSGCQQLLLSSSFYVGNSCIPMNTTSFHQAHHLLQDLNSLSGTIPQTCSPCLHSIPFLNLDGMTCIHKFHFLVPGHCFGLVECVLRRVSWQKHHIYNFSWHIMNEMYLFVFRIWERIWNIIQTLHVQNMHSSQYNISICCKFLKLFIVIKRLLDIACHITMVEVERGCLFLFHWNLCTSHQKCPKRIMHQIIW